MTIARRFRGPPNSGNGGYVCGLLARHIPGAAEITLLRPPPLETPLTARPAKDGNWELADGETVVAAGRATAVAPADIVTASFAEAAEAEARVLIKPEQHLLPMCFVCGPERAHGDGLRIFAGPLARPPSPHGPALAATWQPDASLALPDGRVAPEFVWSAMDCPTGYAVSTEPATGRLDLAPILLGRLALRVDNLPAPGERCVVTAWPTGRDGRKRTAEAALFGGSGTLLAAARATWIVVDRQVQLGRG